MNELPIIDYCRICGLPCVISREESLDELCPSCGNHVGLNDIDLESVKKYRNEWIGKGSKWWSKDTGSEPRAWDPNEQMENIPPEWR